MLEIGRQVVESVIRSRSTGYTGKVIKMPSAEIGYREHTTTKEKRQRWLLTIG